MADYREEAGQIRKRQLNPPVAEDGRARRSTLAATPSPATASCG